VKCWGDNSSGGLGYGDTNDRGDDPSEMGDYLGILNLDGKGVLSTQSGDGHTCALFDDNQMSCWGLNDYGQLGVGTTANQGDASGEMGSYLSTINLGGQNASQISVGSHHSIMVNPSGDVKAWGRNENGQLGYGDTIVRGDATEDSSPNS